MEQNTHNAYTMPSGDSVGTVAVKSAWIHGDAATMAMPLAYRNALITLRNRRRFSNVYMLLAILVAPFTVIDTILAWSMPDGSDASVNPVILLSPFAIAFAFFVWRTFVAPMPDLRTVEELMEDIADGRNATALGLEKMRSVKYSYRLGNSWNKD